jgi:hypothetical protein
MTRSLCKRFTLFRTLRVIIVAIITVVFANARNDRGVMYNIRYLHTVINSGYGRVSSRGSVQNRFRRWGK